MATEAKHFPTTVSPTPIIMPPKYITSFTYNVLDFEMFSKIVFNCHLFDADGTHLDAKTVEISGCDYYNWGNDVDGNPMVFQNIVLDQSNNPILPPGYVIDNHGSVRDSNGVHIVIVI